MRFSSFSILFILVGCTWSTVRKPIRTRYESSVYLNKYGYNTCSNSSKNIICPMDYSTMLRNFQQWHGLSVNGIMDGFTIREMILSRCGNADVEWMKLGEKKWSGSSLSWSLHSYPQQIGREQATSIVRNAFNAWFNHIPLQIEEKCSTCSADILLDFGRYNHGCGGGSFDGPGGTFAHAYYPENGRIHFDFDEKWTEDIDDTGINFYLVAVHEIGHALGIPHNRDRTSIMFPIYDRWPRDRTLPAIDRRAVQALYGSLKDGKGKRACNCSSNQCCSRWGYCGNSDEYCGKGCRSGPCWSVDESPQTPSTCNCQSGQCCSKWGHCGTSDEYCGEGCQAGPCSPTAESPQKTTMCNCRSGQCCSKWGFCGNSDEYCGEGCRSGPCS